MRINRNNKDRLFRAIFGYEKYKDNLLTLFNALNGTGYTETDDLKITTIDDIVYMEMKNDVSCILDSNMSLFEHQSSFNPNMPLRGFMYFGKLYSKYVTTTNLNIYSRSIKKIPTPQYYIFYNGTDKYPDRMELKLSDSFMKPDETHGFEWTATMLNINLGHNEELLSACKVLYEYAILIEKIRQNQRAYKNTNQAITEAINESIQENILAEFLLEHKSEVIEMCLTEYDQERTMRLFQEEERAEGRAKGLEEGREQGIKQGIEQGIEQGRAEERRKLLAVNQLHKLLIEQGREQEIIKAATDEEYQERLLMEYHLL